MIKGEFSNHVVRTVKDQLRDVRFHIRRSARHDRFRGDEHGSLHLPVPVARAADAAFSRFATAATMLAPDYPRRSASLNFPLGVDAYFGGRDGGDPRTQDFTYEIYYAFKALLRRFGAREFLVFEQSVDDAYAKILLRQPDLIAALDAGSTTERAASVTRLCAAVASELAAARPIKELLLDPGAATTPKNLFLSPNAYCACVIGLSTAMVSLRPDAPGGEPEAERDEIIESADLAVDARFSRLIAALRSRDPIGGLASEFAAILPVFAVVQPATESRTVNETKPLLDPVPDLRPGVLRLGWFRESFKQKAGALIERYGLSLAVDERALAQAFVNWALAFHRERPDSMRNRRDFTVFSGGILLRELLRAGPLRAHGKAEPRQSIPPDPMARIGEFWPEGFVCAEYCLTIVRAIAEQDCDVHASASPALEDLRTWQSFRENFVEDSSAAAPFFELFMGEAPNWTFPAHFRSRPSVGAAT
jgi:hypothetical protein